MRTQHLKPTPPEFPPWDIISRCSLPKLPSRYPVKVLLILAGLVDLGTAVNEPYGSNWSIHINEPVSPVSVIILKIFPDAVQGMVFAIVDTFIGEVYQ